MAQQNWTRDEIVLLCEVLASNGWVAIRAHHREADELSEIMREISEVPGSERGATFRSPSSIQRKAYDLITARSTYSGATTKGGRLTRQIVQEWERNPALIEAEAKALRAAASGRDQFDVLLDIDEELDEIEAAEGRRALVEHYKRERNTRLRQVKLAAVLATGGRLECEVCGFDFAATYGDLGKGFIEVHHVLPLHVSGETITRLQDLALLCSNCHRMIHRSRPWLTPAGLQRLLP